MSKTIILTGGCGFIGHHFAEYVFKNTDWNIIIIDKLSYASLGLNRLRNNELLYSNRVKVFTLDYVMNYQKVLKKKLEMILII
jgi:dTDP-D-glucose 4,6-dehydratase